jgi:hypothetical protein
MSKKFMWLNIYPKDVFNVHATRELADKNAYEERVYCVRVEYDDEEVER